MITNYEISTATVQAISSAQSITFYNAGNSEAQILFSSGDLLTVKSGSIENYTPNDGTITDSLTISFSKTTKNNLLNITIVT
jgi:hypothetical protein